MRSLAFVAPVLVLGSAAAMAAWAATTAPKAKAGTLQLQSACPPALTAYQPGVDVYGRPVVPADLPDNGGLSASPRTVVPKLHSTNPQLDGMRVVVAIDGVEQSQALVPCVLGVKPSARKK